METYCEGRQNGTHCYGALEGTVDIQLMDGTLEIPRYQLLKQINEFYSLRILFGRNNTVFSNIIEHRAFFVSSHGTFRINNLKRNDSGKYTLETFDSEGNMLEEQTLQLFIEGNFSSMIAPINRFKFYIVLII